MYKMIAIIILTMLFITGCNKVDGVENDSITSSESETNSESVETLRESQRVIDADKGVQLHILPEESTEGILVVELTNKSNSEIIYGEWYVIEVCKDGTWYELPTIIEDVEFHDIAYPVEAQQTREHSISYQWIYELKPFTQYRIIKDYMDAQKNKYYIAEEFEISFRTNDQ